MPIEIPASGYIVIPPYSATGVTQIMFSRWSRELEKAFRTSRATHASAINFVGGGGTGLEFLEQFAGQLEALNVSGKIAPADLAPVGELRRLPDLTLAAPAEGIDFARMRGLRRCAIVRGGTLGTIGEVPGLRHLSLFECKVRDLTPIGMSRSLRSLQIYLVRALTTLAGIEALKLEKVELTYASGLKTIRSLTAIDTLREVRIIGGKAITDLECLGEVKSLRDIMISGPDISSLEWVRGLKQLESFATQNTAFVGKRVSVAAFAALPKLTKLAFIGIPKRLDNLADIERLGRRKSLVELRIMGGPDLPSLKFLRPLVNLRILNISRSRILDGDLGILFKMPNLEEIQVDPPASAREAKSYPDRYSHSVAEINALARSRGGKARM